MRDRCTSRWVENGEREHKQVDWSPDLCLPLFVFCHPPSLFVPFFFLSWNMTHASGSRWDSYITNNEMFCARYKKRRALLKKIAMSADTIKKTKYVDETGKKNEYFCFLKIKVYAANFSPKNKLVVHHTHIRERTYRQRIQQGLECEFKTRELLRVSTTGVTILVIRKKMFPPQKQSQLIFTSFKNKWGFRRLFWHPKLAVVNIRPYYWDYPVLCNPAYLCVCNLLFLFQSIPAHMPIYPYFSFIYVQLKCVYIVNSLVYIVLLYRIVLYHNVLSCAVLYHIVSCCLVSYLFLWFGMVLYGIESCRLISYHIVSCCLMSCCVVSYRIFSYGSITYHIV